MTLLDRLLLAVLVAFAVLCIALVVKVMTYDPCPNCPNVSLNDPGAMNLPDAPTPRSQIPGAP